MSGETPRIDDIEDNINTLLAGTGGVICAYEDIVPFSSANLTGGLPVEYVTPVYDPLNTYDRSTKLFTVPAGESGLYSVTAKFKASCSIVSAIKVSKLVSSVATDFEYSVEVADFHQITTFFMMNAGDQIQVAMLGWSGSGTPTGTLTSDPSHKLLIQQVKKI